ncbi:unnamed protein product, partial [Ixodes hexagonus]
RPIDCVDIFKRGGLSSGVYTIQPSNRPVTVFCDMSDGGGWTVIQRRGQFGNSGYYFNRNWDEYRDGFGNKSNEYWLGNRHIFQMTKRSHKLKIILTYPDGRTEPFEYQSFQVLDRTRDYKLRLSSPSDRSDDSFFPHSGRGFATYDHPKDNECATGHSGGWWFKAPNAKKKCTGSNLNGLNLNG